MNIDNITLIIPSHNNLQYLENAYYSIRGHYRTVKVILMDDGSTDSTEDWILEKSSTDPNLLPVRYEERLGHTIRYDQGVGLAETEIVGILHADMIVGPNYLENMVKHLSKGKVVCATRIEPPLHPPGPEKIIHDFGQQADDLQIEKFEQYCHLLQSEGYHDNQNR